MKKSTTPYEMRQVITSTYAAHGASPRLAAQIADAYNQLFTPWTNCHLHANGHTPHPAAYFRHGLDLLAAGNAREGCVYVKRAVDVYPSPEWEVLLLQIQEVSRALHAAEPAFAELRRQWYGTPHPPHNDPVHV